MFNNVDHFFKEGLINFLMDGQHGSSGKAKMEAYLTKHYSGKAPLIAISSNTPNASHTVVDEGKEIVFKALPSACFYPEKVDLVYINNGAGFEVDNLFREIEETGISRDKIRISPLAMVVTEDDADLERGVKDLFGNDLVDRNDGTVKTGSTCSGSGAVLAKRALRNKTLVLAQDVPELEDMIDHDYPYSLMRELDAGATALYTIAQGFPLSNGHPGMYPYVTSRNVTVTHALDDAFLPVIYAGNVFINFRTYPIRIHDKKYRSLETGEFLVWDEKEAMDESEYEVVDSFSGHFYEDSKELTWEEITELSGSDTKLFECTTLTKLPRRIATFSTINLIDAISINRTGHKVFLGINFANYVDNEMSFRTSETTEKFDEWLDKYVTPVLESNSDVELMLIGTQAGTDDMIVHQERELVGT